MHDLFLYVMFLSTAIASPVAQWDTPSPDQTYNNPNWGTSVNINPPQIYQADARPDAGAGQGDGNPSGSLVPQNLFDNFLEASIPPSCPKTSFYCCPFLSGEPISETAFPKTCRPCKTLGFHLPSQYVLMCFHR